MHAEISHMHVKDPVVHVRVRWIMKKPKMAQQTLKRFQSIQSVEVGDYIQENKKRQS